MSTATFETGGDPPAEMKLGAWQASGNEATKKPFVLISHPTGNQNLRNALRSLVENEMLAEF